MANADSVLLVDDDRDTQELYRMALTVAGFDVVEAGDGEEALSVAFEWLPSVIVTSVCFPNVDGVELVERLQADPRTAHIPVIVLTGWQDDAVRSRAIANGATFIIKPCLPDVLVARVFRAIDGAVAAIGPDTAGEEHDRLKRRTARLAEEHTALAPDLAVFDKAAHDEHSADLRQHRADLGAHRRRLRRL
jgi:PleD family two-component response regulator